MRVCESELSVHNAQMQLHQGVKTSSHFPFTGANLFLFTPVDAYMCSYSFH